MKENPIQTILGINCYDLLTERNKIGFRKIRLTNLLKATNKEPAPKLSETQSLMLLNIFISEYYKNLTDLDIRVVTIWAQIHSSKFMNYSKAKKLTKALEDSKKVRDILSDMENKKLIYIDDLNCRIQQNVFDNMFEFYTSSKDEKTQNAILYEMKHIRKRKLLLNLLP